MAASKSDALTVTFTPRSPSIVELTAKRILDARDAPKGLVSTAIDSTVTIGGDGPKVARAVITVTMRGVSGDEREAFEAVCTVDCRYDFESPIAEESLDDPELRRQLCEPLYHRAALQAQELAWRMGYNAVRAPLLYRLKDLPTKKTRTKTKRTAASKEKASSA